MSNETHISLGKALNHLLDRNTQLGKRTGGLELPTPGNRDGKMSVVVIQGEPGSGKSTLALQIAVHAAKSGICSLFLSLEDHPVVVKNKAEDFGRVTGDSRSWADFVFQPTSLHVTRHGPIQVSSPRDSLNATIKAARKEVIAAVKPKKHVTPPGAVIATSLLPRPIDDSPERTRQFFDEQYNYLETLVNASVSHWKTDRTGGVRLIVIDSLNMLCYSPQSRESTYRIFDLFRANGIMGIFTADSGNEAVRFDSTMADVVFAFSSKTASSYLVKYLSVDKSRYTPTSFGLHPCKITPQDGIRVLPSLHAVVQATQGGAHSSSSGAFPFGWSDDLTKYVVRSSLKRPGVVALHGPRGTRKSTMAVNFLIHGLVGETEGTVPRESGLLIRLKDTGGEYTSFSQVQSYVSMNLARQKKLAKLSLGLGCTKRLLNSVPSSKAAMEVWGNCDHKRDDPILVVVDFNTGMLLPEEFVDIVQGIFDAVDYPWPRIQRLALDDVSVIGTGSYPLLERSETTADLFLAAFVHVVRNLNVDLMLVGTRGHLRPGNEIVDRAIALADSVVETRIKDIFGDRYVLLSGDGSMADDPMRGPESVPPVLRLVKDKSTPPIARMDFDRYLLRGLTGFEDDATVARTKVFAYLYEENPIHVRYNCTLPYLLEPYCGLPDLRGSSGLKVIPFWPEISDTVHRSVAHSSTVPPKEHTVLATIDEFDVSGGISTDSKPYTKNVLLVAWNQDACKNASGETPWSSWRQLLRFASRKKENRKPTVWVDRVARETMACCLVDCLMSGWKLERNHDKIPKGKEGEVWKEICKALGTQSMGTHFIEEAAAMHKLFSQCRNWIDSKHALSLSARSKEAAYSPAEQPSLNIEREAMPPDATIYICWYSQLRYFLEVHSDSAARFQVAALPGGGFVGDWNLRVLPGSVSLGLGEAVVTSLTSPDEDYRRFSMGLGLPAGPDGKGKVWRDQQFRAWPGANKDMTLAHVYKIHAEALRRSNIEDYRTITRVLSTFARRLAGDWEAGKAMDVRIVAHHLGRLPSLLKAVLSNNVVGS